MDTYYITNKENIMHARFSNSLLTPLIFHGATLNYFCGRFKENKGFSYLLPLHFCTVSSLLRLGGCCSFDSRDAPFLPILLIVTTPTLL